MRPLLRIAQHRVSLIDLRELLRRSRLFVAVGVKFQGQFAVCTFDGVGVGSFCHAQQLVVIHDVFSGGQECGQADFQLYAEHLNMTTLRKRSP